MPSVHPAIEVVKKTLQELLPNQKPEEREKMLQLVLKNIDKQEDKPNLTINMKELKTYIEQFVDNHLFKNEFDKTINQYTNLEKTEKEDLKNEVKKDMKKMQEKGLDLKKNPKALEVMMKLLVLKHCLYPSPEILRKYPLGLKHRLKVGLDTKKEMNDSIHTLKIEYTKLLKELEESLKKTNPDLAKKLTEEMQKLFLEIEKKLTSEKDNKDIKDELTKLFRAVIILKSPEFKDLPPEDKVTIIAQGSKSGQYAMFPRNDVDIPNDIIVFPHTPAAAEKKDQEASSICDVRKLPTPNPFDDK